MRQPPQYDFKNDPRLKDPRLRCLAKEHLQLASLRSDVITWEVIETISPLRIPIVYYVHFRIKTIVGIQPDNSPIYGNHHILELAPPELYPLESCKITMKTDVWHPNIKSEGKFKGRVCGNTNDFGLTYDLYQLILRIGEILQYKNYHAEHTPPFPEDSKVAQWVLEYAEPNGIVDKNREICVDDTPLVRDPNLPDPDPEPEPEPPPAPPPPPSFQIKITPAKQPEQPKTKITIRPKE